MGAVPDGAVQERRVRLLWLIDSLNVGGAERLVVSFLRAVDRQRFDVTVACLTAIDGNAIEEAVRAEGFEVVNLGARSLRDVGAFRRLLRMVRERRIDLVHAHLTYAATWSALASKLTGVPSIATLHVAPAEGSRAAGLRDRLMTFLLNRWSSRVVMVSEALRTAYAKQRGLRLTRSVTVHNGIDLSSFRGDSAARARLLREFSLPEESLIAATVAVLRPGKGVEVLLESIAAIVRQEPRARFLVIGDGSERAELQQLAARLGVDSFVRWAGYRSDVGALLAGCDLLVHPSLEDAFPTVLLEAMAAGLPVVATRVGGIPEIVSGDTGVLVRAGDALELGESVSGLLRNAARREAMRNVAPRIADERFSTRAWLERLERVYGEVLQESAR